MRNKNVKIYVPHYITIENEDEHSEFDLNFLNERRNSEGKLSLNEIPIE